MVASWPPNLAACLLERQLTGSATCVKGHDSFGGRLKVTKTLDAHQGACAVMLTLSPPTSSSLTPRTGCVNTCEWSDDGSLLVTGSDDLNVHLYGAATLAKTGACFTGHSNNIFDAKPLPSRCDTLVTTAADGEVRLLNLLRGAAPLAPSTRRSVASAAARATASELLFCSRSSGFGMRIAFLPNCPQAFLVSHQDGCVRMIDLREPTAPTRAARPLVDLAGHCGAASDIAFRPACGGSDVQFAVGCDDPYVRLFDLRRVTASSNRTDDDMPGPEPYAKLMPTSILRGLKHERFAGMSEHRIWRGQVDGVSGLAWHPDGRHLLASYRGADVYLLDTQRQHTGLSDDVSGPTVQRYRGRRNDRTFLKNVAFLGDDAQFITCGGDCGSVFVWHTRTGALATRMRADQQVLNCVAPHPHNLPMMAVSGIDDDAKIVSIGPAERDSNAWCLPRGSKASEEASAGRPDADFARDEPDELVNGAAGRGGAGGGDDSEDDGDGGRGIRFAGSEEDAARLFAMLRGVLPPELLANVRFLPVGRRRGRQEEQDEEEGSGEEGSDDEESGSSDEGADDEEEEEVAHEDIPAEQ